MSDKLIKYYILAVGMFGKITYPKKGKIALNEDTSQKDLEYLFCECKMTNGISELQVTKKQLEIFEAKTKNRKERRENKETERATPKKNKKEIKEEDTTD